jgi:FkbM family methyltransferase
MLRLLIKFLEILNTPGALLALIQWKKFSFSSYKIINRAKLFSINPKTVIDVGANEGQFTVACSKLFENVNIYPIEPSQKVALKLKNNVGNLASQNVIITAVGDYIGYANFNVNSDSQVSSLLDLGKERVQYFPHSYVMDKVEVPITTLDELFAKKVLEKPIMLKIDVQGAEDLVIKGARQILNQIDWVLIEVSFGRLYKGEKSFNLIVEMMAECGFKFLKPLNFHTSPKTLEIIEMDALFKKE